MLEVKQLNIVINFLNFFLFKALCTYNIMSCIRGDAGTDMRLLHNYYEAPPHSNHTKSFA